MKYLRKPVCILLIMLSCPFVVFGFVFALCCHSWLAGVELYGKLWE